MRGATVRDRKALPSAEEATPIRLLVEASFERARGHPDSLLAQENRPETAPPIRRFGTFPRSRIGVLASGRGSNLQAIIDSITEGRLDAEVAVVISDVEDAHAHTQARNGGIRAHYVELGAKRSRKRGHTYFPFVPDTSPYCSESYCGDDLVCSYYQLPDNTLLTSVALRTNVNAVRNMAGTAPCSVTPLERN